MEHIQAQLPSPPPGELDPLSLGKRSKTRKEKEKLAEAEERNAAGGRLGTNNKRPSVCSESTDELI